MLLNNILLMACKFFCFLSSILLVIYYCLASILPVICSAFRLYFCNIYCNLLVIWWYFASDLLHHANSVLVIYWCFANVFFASIFASVLLVIWWYFGSILREFCWAFDGISQVIRCIMLAFCLCFACVLLLSLRSPHSNNLVVIY